MLPLSLFLFMLYSACTQYGLADSKNSCSGNNNLAVTQQMGIVKVPTVIQIIMLYPFFLSVGFFVLSTGALGYW